MRLKDKVCIITGAGSGMGRVACEIFAREGAKVAAFEIAPGSGEETVERVRAAGGEATVFRCDVADEASVREAVAATMARYGGVDVLYNNAGIMPEDDHSVTDTSVEIVGPGDGGERARAIPLLQVRHPGDAEAVAVARSSTSPRSSRWSGAASRRMPTPPRRGR